MDPTTRRLLVLAAGALTPVLNAKMGLNIPGDQVLGVLTLATAYIIGSNWKEAQLAHAEAAGAAAAAAVTNPVAVLADAAAKEAGK